MAIPVTCKACGSGFQVRDDFGGKRGRCPTCGEVVDVPAADKAPPPRGEERRDPPSSKSRSASPDRDDDRPPRRERERDRGRERERERDDRDRERERGRRYDDDDDGERDEVRRPRRIGYGWRTAASAATPMMVGYIILAVAGLVFLLCEFGTFGLSPSALLNPSPSQQVRLRSLQQQVARPGGPNFGNPNFPNFAAEFPVGFLVQGAYILDPLHPIFLLLGSALATAGTIFLAVGHGRLRSCPVRQLSGFSGLANIFTLIAMGLFVLGFVLGLLFLLVGSTGTALLAIPFYGSALAAVGVLVGLLLHGIALMDLGRRYYAGGLRWFSLGVWIAVAVLILLVVIFTLTTISGYGWVRVFLKAGGTPFGGFGRPPGGFAALDSQTNGVYITFLILSLAACVVSIFPLLMAKRELLTGEPPAAPPPRRRPRREYDDYDDRPRDRDRDRYREDDYDNDRPRRRGRDDY